MFERFTQEARQVVVMAQEEARLLGHNYIGTEHLLLGLLHDPDGPAGMALMGAGLSLEATRAHITSIVPAGEDPPAQQVPFTPRAKKVLELAMREALELGDNNIRPEHLLLGLIREGEGVAGRVLRERGIEMQRLRAAVATAGFRQRGRGPLAAATVGTVVTGGWLDGLQALLDALDSDIRRHLGREPDAGDLMLVLVSVTDMLPGQAISRLNLDLDALWATVEHLRRQALAEAAALQAEIDTAAREKERAIEEERTEDAARLRDRERELRVKASQLERSDLTQALETVRRRLGIPEV